MKSYKEATKHESRFCSMNMSIKEINHQKRVPFLGQVRVYSSPPRRVQGQPRTPQAT